MAQLYIKHGVHERASHQFVLLKKINKAIENMKWMFHYKTTYLDRVDSFVVFFCLSTDSPSLSGCISKSSLLFTGSLSTERKTVVPDPQWGSLPPSSSKSHVITKTTSDICCVYFCTPVPKFWFFCWQYIKLKYLALRISLKQCGFSLNLLMSAASHGLSFNSRASDPLSVSSLLVPDPGLMYSGIL